MSWNVTGTVLRVTLASVVASAVGLGMRSLFVSEPSAGPVEVSAPSPSSAAESKQTLSSLLPSAGEKFGPVQLPSLVQQFEPAILEKVWVAGVVRSERWVTVDRGGKKAYIQPVNVVLTDGTVFTERDVELQEVTRNSVTISGRKIFFAPSASGRRADLATLEQGTLSPLAQKGGESVPSQSASGEQSSPRDAGSWYVDGYGVSRLRSAITLGK